MNEPINWSFLIPLSVFGGGMLILYLAWFKFSAFIAAAFERLSNGADKPW